VALLAGTTSAMMNDGKYCYNSPGCGEDTWIGACNAPESNRQSPIDLLSEEVIDSEVKLHAWELVDSGIKFNQAYKDDISNFYIKNSGHSIQLQAKQEPTSDMQVRIQDWNYTLAQVRYFCKQLKICRSYVASCPLVRY